MRGTRYYFYIISLSYAHYYAEYGKMGHSASQRTGRLTKDKASSEVSLYTTSAHNELYAVDMLPYRIDEARE